MSNIEGGKGVSAYSVLACFLLFVLCSWENYSTYTVLTAFHRRLFLEIIISCALFFKNYYMYTVLINWSSPYLAFSSFISHKIDISYDKNHDDGP